MRIGFLVSDLPTDHRKVLVASCFSGLKVPKKPYLVNRNMNLREFFARASIDYERYTSTDFIFKVQVPPGVR